MYDVTVSVRAMNDTSSQLYFYINVASDTVPVLKVLDHPHYLIERDGEMVRVHLTKEKVPGCKKAQKTGRKDAPGAYLCVPISRMLDFPNEYLGAQPIPVRITPTGFEFRVTYALLQDLQQPKVARPLEDRQIMSEPRALGVPLPLTADELFDLGHKAIRMPRETTRPAKTPKKKAA